MSEQLQSEEQFRRNYECLRRLFDYAGDAIFVHDLDELKAAPVLVSAGNQDPIVHTANARELVALLRRAGADVTVCFENAGHALTDTTLATTRRWLAEKAILRGGSESSAAT